MRGVFFIGLVFVMLSQSAFSGQLDDFEEKAEKKADPSPAPPPPRSRSRSSDSIHTSSFGSGTYPSSRGGASFMGSFWTWMVTAPFGYRHDDPAAAMLPRDGTAEEEDWADTSLFLEHQLGGATLPYIRADVNWQYINSNLEAGDLRVEAGYKLLAFHGRHTVYTESNPSDELTINQYYGVLRFGGSLSDPALPHASWEIGLGLGAAQQQGNQEHSSGAFTIPIKFHPADWVGIEFRPAWYKPQDRIISDYDVSASLGYRYVQLRGGYRWLWLQGEGHFFNGPYAGVSVSF
jgi:hypothetical protein